MKGSVEIRTSKHFVGALCRRSGIDPDLFENDAEWSFAEFTILLGWSQQSVDQMVAAEQA